MIAQAQALVIVFLLVTLFHLNRRVMHIQEVLSKRQPDIRPHLSSDEFHSEIQEEIGLIPPGVSMKAYNLNNSFTEFGDVLDEFHCVAFLEAASCMSPEDQLWLLEQVNSLDRQRGCALCWKVAAALANYLGFPSADEREWSEYRDGEFGPGND